VQKVDLEKVFFCFMFHHPKNNKPRFFFFESTSLSRMTPVFFGFVGKRHLFFFSVWVCQMLFDKVALTVATSFYVTSPCLPTSLVP
jgi:hypothetical protein